MQRPTIFTLIIALWALVPLSAEKPAKPNLEEFLRFSEDADVGLLETAIVSYENEKSVVLTEHVCNNLLVERL